MTISIYYRIENSNIFDSDERKNSPRENYFCIFKRENEGRQIENLATKGAILKNYCIASNDIIY
jgi:hypothetical protein